MYECYEQIEVNKEKWKKVALAVGDTNPIHYLENGAICPGLYLFSDAEKKAREDGRFQLPLKIKGNFTSLVYDKDRLILDKDYSKNKSVFTYFKNNECKEKVAEFEFDEILEISIGNYNFNGKFEKAKEILGNELDSFDEALGIKDNKRIYSAFVVGRVLEKFLAGREGSLLHNIEFNFYRELVLNDFLIKLDVTRETRKRGRKEITDYVIRGEAIQFDETIAIGFGNAQHKIVKAA